MAGFKALRRGPTGSSVTLSVVGTLKAWRFWAGFNAFGRGLTGSSVTLSVIGALKAWRFRAGFNAFGHRGTGSMGGIYALGLEGNGSKGICRTALKCGQGQDEMVDITPCWSIMR